MAAERELELVREYLEEHFGPIAKEVIRRFSDPQVRELALRRATRHIYHWAEDRSLLDALEDGVYPNVEEVLEAGENGGGRDPPPAAKRGVPVTVEPAERPPEDWRTGDEPATTKQKQVLLDRGVQFAPGISKAEASRLISDVTEG